MDHELVAQCSREYELDWLQKEFQATELGRRYSELFPKELSQAQEELENKSLELERRYSELFPKAGGYKLAR